ncbi:MAG: helix-turn-helix transcriptional regulator [Roseiarcus sp.]|jgi:transcriptional regulator with XRE-family HTH domain
MAKKYRIHLTGTALKSGGQIKTARKLAGLTQAELAKLARVSKRSVARWEAKTGQPASRPVDGWICDAFESVGVEFFDTPTLGARLAEQAG